MRRLLLPTALAASIVAVPGVAMAGSADAPLAACNAGTMTAHQSVPETTGNGSAIMAHAHIPVSVGDACVHGAFA